MSKLSKSDDAVGRVAKKETEGAWVIHHGSKIMMDANGAAEFPSIDQASKATTLIVSLAGTDADEIPKEAVQAIARAARINPKHELKSLLEILEEKRLVEVRDDSVKVLGLSTRAALQHASDLFRSSDPEQAELAALDVGELTSQAPQPVALVEEYVGDTYKFKKEDAKDFMRRAEEIGFIDAEGQGADRLVFNGNLFRRETVNKTKKVLDSLSTEQERKVVEFNDVLNRRGCLPVEEAIKILGQSLLDKLKAAGVFELHSVQNEDGEHMFVSSPAAFHKFVSPMVDDAFDLAKALVAALTYGMTRRTRSTGQIQMLDVLLGKLINGYAVGPATAIGQDYRVLEQKRVVQLIPDGNLYRMRLLKKEVGQIALQVLQQGNATGTIVENLPAAPMTGYIGPEQTRAAFRKNQAKPSRKATHDIILALRSNKRF